MINKETIRAQLDKINQKGKIAPKPYQDFMPVDLGFEPRDTTLMYDRLAQIDQTGENATQLTQIQAQNTKDYNIMIERQQAQRRAQDALNAANENKPKLDPKDPVAGPSGSFDLGSAGDYTPTENYGKYWGKDNTPEVSDLRNGVNPNAPLVTMNFHGKSFQVNRQVAPIFSAFLNQLYASGYRPMVIGGHANRNIAGTNTPSLHSLGLAIDIDPTQNPVQYGGANRNILPPNVASMAARYGLSWGGSWNSYKDPMHFSVAYGGRE